MNTSELWAKLQHSLLDNFYKEVKEENIMREQRPVVLLSRKVNCTPSVEVEKLRKKLYELDEKIVLAKQDYSNALIEYEIQWALSEERVQDLQHLFPQLELYQKGCMVAKARYRKRELKEREELKIKTQEAEKLKKELACLKNVKQKIDSRLENFLIFKDYLINVVAESKDEFKDLHSLMKSFDDLLKFKQSLHQKTTANILDRLMKSKEFSEFAEEQQAEAITSALYLDQLKVHSPVLEESNFRKEDVLYMTKEQSQKKIRAISSLRAAIRNLYVLLCEQMNQPITLKEEDFQHQCRFIEKYMKEVEKLKVTGKVALETTSEAVVVPKSCYGGPGRKSYYRHSKKDGQIKPQVIKSPVGLLSLTQTAKKV